MFKPSVRHHGVMASRRSEHRTLNKESYSHQACDLYSWLSSTSRTKNDLGELQKSRCADSGAAARRCFHCIWLPGPAGPGSGFRLPYDRRGSRREVERAHNALD
jgi:hypothetical protein